MKVNRLEAHDRLLHLKKDQSLNIQQGAEDCLKKNSLSIALQEHSPYIYIYAHPRTADDGVNKRMLWQPRLSKPKSSPNSYLFRAISKTDIIEICWMLPPDEIWNQYSKGNVTENEIVTWSIEQFRFNRAELEKPHSDDLSDEAGEKIYRAIRAEFKQDEMREKLFRPGILEASSNSLKLIL